MCEYHRMIKFVLTFTKNELTLVELYFGLDIRTCQIKLRFVQFNTKSTHMLKLLLHDIAVHTYMYAHYFTYTY